MDEYDHRRPTAAESPAATAPVGARRLWARALVVAAVAFLSAFVVLAQHRGHGCVGRTGSTALDACRASAAALEPWLVLTGAAALVLVCLAVLVRATD
ncbi:hypothetical protein ACFW9U_23120 [Rhodococcus aetherivorans]|uniref:hypothetical protein n=1 Tax=Rhodococcus aetherivorans TaxID=191292 RepID=UPI00366DC424